MERGVAKRHLGDVGVFDEKADAVLVGHSDFAMHLDRLVGDVDVRVRAPALGGGGHESALNRQAPVDRTRLSSARGKQNRCGAPRSKGSPKDCPVLPTLCTCAQCVAEPKLLLTIQTS
jgi:hypothetical protein